MRCFVILALLGVVFQPACGHQYFTKLEPATEGEVYEMRVGEIVTFELTTFEKTDGGEVPVDVKIDKTFWNYNKRLLDKIHSDNYSLKLRAVRIGTAGLEVTTFIQNRQDIKNLTILIKE